MSFTSGSIAPNAPASVTIGLSLPRGLSGNANATSTPALDGNWKQEAPIYAQAVGSVTPALVSKEYELRVYLMPTSTEIFTRNPEIWLFRNVNRSNSSLNSNAAKFRADGIHWVHPTHLPIPGNQVIGQRFYGGTHNGTGLARITEVSFPLSGDFYGGRASAPKGLNFKFKPLAWFIIDNAIIQSNNVSFPQVMFENQGLGSQPNSGIEQSLIHDSIGPINRTFRYGGHKRRKGKQRLNYHFALAMMIDNPEYDGGTQVARKIIVSNFVDFTVGYKTVNLTDTDSVLRKFAVDWRLSLGTSRL